MGGLKSLKYLRVNRNINKLHLCRLLFFIILIITINFLCYRIFLDLSWVNTSLQKVVFYPYSFFICVRMLLADEVMSVSAVLLAGKSMLYIHLHHGLWQNTVPVDHCEFPLRVLFGESPLFRSLLFGQMFGQCISLLFGVV